MAAAARQLSRASTVSSSFQVTKLPSACRFDQIRGLGHSYTLSWLRAGSVLCRLSPFLLLGLRLTFMITQAPHL